MKDSASVMESPHIIVTEAPPGFLKRKNVRHHFNRYGKIVRMSIQNTFCVITFENHKQANHALKHGTQWKGMPLKIDFTSTHDPFGLDEALITSELNWCAEDPECSFVSKPSSSKSSLGSRFSDPPKKFMKIDITDDDDTSKSSEETRLKPRWSEESNLSPKSKRKSATSRFLEGISKQKSDESKLSRSFDETRLKLIRPSDEDKVVTGFREDQKTKSKISDEFKFTSKFSDGDKLLEEPGTTARFPHANKSKLAEEFKFASNFSNEDKFPSRLFEDQNMKSKFSEENKPSSKLFEEFKFTSKLPEEGNKTSQLREDNNTKSKLLEESKQGSKILEEFKFTSKLSDEGSNLMELSEDNKPKSKLSEESKKGLKTVEEFKFTSKLNDKERSALGFSEDKTKSKFPEESKYSSTFSDSGKVKVKVPEEFKLKADTQEGEMLPKYSDNSASVIVKSVEDKFIPKLSGESRSSDENKPETKSSEENKVVFKSSDAPFYSRVALTLQEKLNILEERDRQIRLKLEKVTRIDSSVQGTCPDMCPEKERVLRELMGIIAPYESFSDGRMDYSKAVKEYARSSADQDEPLPHDLRPEPVLTMTMTYLINCIISRIDEVGEENQSYWYDFCWGRLRAIRKDIIQQQLCDKNTVVILEQCARFHIACYDRLWGTSKSQFDDKINTETLVNCLQSLIHMYEDLQKKGIVCPNEAEFNGYLILLKINSGFLMSEYQRYSKNLKESKLVKEAVKIHLAYNNNMYSTFFKLAKQTSYLNACLMQRFFQHLRVQALNTTVKAHCIPNKLSTIPAEFIMDTLKLDSIDDCISFCESMGLTYTGKEKSFRVSRNDFYITDNSYRIETPSSLILNKRIPIAEAVVGDSSPLPIYLNHTVHSSFNEEGVLTESAIDASDQEEKMLRDDVERKLLISQLKATFSHKLNKEKSSESISLDVSPAEMVTNESLKEEVGEEENELEYSDNEESSFKNSEVDSGFLPETSEAFSQLDELDKTDHHRPIPPINLDTQTLKPSSPQEHTVSPKLFPERIPPSTPSTAVNSETKTINEYSFPKSLFSTKDETVSLSSTQDSSIKVPDLPKLNIYTKVDVTVPLKCSKPSLNSPLTTMISDDKPKSPKTPKSPRTPLIEKKAFTKFSDIKENKEKLYMDKLRSKLRENMKRVSARKYLRLWKEKALKLKSSNELEAMLLYNMTAKEYIRLWGKAPVKRSFNLTNRLSTRKKSNLMVQMILHTDIVDKIDRNVRKIGCAVINALGETSVRKADSWGNIAQPNPVFWKLVFALPPPPEGGTTFSMKLRSWCKAAFYDKKDSRLSGGELQISDTGVPVFSRVSVVEGLHQVEACSNLTALVVVRARDWESVDETENRLHKLLSLKNHPIPVAVLNIGQHIDHVNIRNRAEVTHFEQGLWDNSRTMKRVLCNLAHNICLYNLKVKPFCHLVEVSSEKLFDMLHQDSFLHDGLDDALVNPNNIIQFYNQLIDRIGNEIIQCQIKNYFGTAFEFKTDFEKNNGSLNFPDNYDDLYYEKSFSLRCRKCKLRPFKTKFQDKKDLISFFKNYCDDIGCLNVYKKLVRLLNLPSDEEKCNLTEHLHSVQWLPLVELIIKEILTSDLLTFKVVYREDLVKNILDSRFWFNSDIIKKRC